MANAVPIELMGVMLDSTVHSLPLESSSSQLCNAMKKNGVEAKSSRFLVFKQSMKIFERAAYSRGRT